MDQQPFLQPEKYAMSLAGLDPSGGAGLLADIKTFEAHQIIGFGVSTALTMQTDNAFFGVEWIPTEQIIAQAAPLLEKFPVEYCKIGLIEHPSMLLKVIPALLRIRPGLKFILDPVLKASAGFVFHQDEHAWNELLSHVFLLTPNAEEANALGGVEKLAAHCSVLLKGGHRTDKPGWDTLYHAGGHTDFPPIAIDAPAKHGSGCVLSAGITAALAEGYSLEEACFNGKAYTYKFLLSSPGLLGRHQN